MELEHYAANTPDITGLAPSQLQDDLGRPVVSGGHNTAVVLPVERGRAEVDELHSGVSHPSDVPLIGGAVFAVPVVAYKQNVFGLQIRVSQMIFVEKLETDLELITLELYSHTEREVWAWAYPFRVKFTIIIEYCRIKITAILNRSSQDRCVNCLNS